MRTTLRTPGDALQELYEGVVKELRASSTTPPSGSISGVITWYDPTASWPEGLGDLPVVAVDPKGTNVSILPRAPGSSPIVGDPVSVLEPPFPSEVVSGVRAGSCVIVDGARPDCWADTTLP